MQCLDSWHLQSCIFVSNQSLISPVSSSLKRRPQIFPFSSLMRFLTLTWLAMVAPCLAAVTASAMFILESLWEPGKKGRRHRWSGGGLHSTDVAFLLPTQQPRVRIPARPRQYFLSLLLRLWTVVRPNPFSAKQWISQIQLAVMSRAKCTTKRVATRMRGKFRSIT